MFYIINLSVTFAFECYRNSFIVPKYYNRIRKKVITFDDVYLDQQLKTKVEIQFKYYCTEVCIFKR